MVKIIVLFLLFLCCPAVLADSEDSQVLKGLAVVSVSALRADTEKDLDWMSEAIKSRTAQKLMAAGLGVVDGRKSPFPIPVLMLVVSSFPSCKKVVQFRIQIVLKEMVLLKRDIHRSIAADTWHHQEDGICVQRGEIAIKTDAVVDRFIQDWRAANPASASSSPGESAAR